MNFRTLYVVISAITLCGCATSYVATPMPSSGQQVRFDRGAPTIFSDLATGSIQITSAGYNEDDNRLVFGVAAFNKLGHPVNFGTENITAGSQKGALTVYTKEALAHEAKVKATWQAVGTVLAGAAAAYAANENAYHTTHGYIATPYGGASFSATSYDPYAAQLGTAIAAASTAYSLNSIQNSLDQTLSRLSGEMLQTTTVDPGAAVGGVIVIDMPKGKPPQSISAEITFANDKHIVQFIVTRDDQPRPVVPAASLTTNAARSSPSPVSEGWSEAPVGPAPMAPAGARPGITIPYPGE